MGCGLRRSKTGKRGQIVGRELGKIGKKREKSRVRKSTLASVWFCRVWQRSKWDLIFQNPERLEYLAPDCKNTFFFRIGLHPYIRAWKTLSVAVPQPNFQMGGGNVEVCRVYILTWLCFWKIMFWRIILFTSQPQSLDPVQKYPWPLERQHRVPKCKILLVIWNRQVLHHCHQSSPANLEMGLWCIWVLTSPHSSGKVNNHYADMQVT